MTRTTVLLAVLALLLAVPASAQSRDEFAYWDANGNGDLTCSEALGRDEGLKLPAYRDNRDGTGLIYEWLQRRRSSDPDGDGTACESNFNPDGYIPFSKPVEVCPADAETWRGLRVCAERPRDGYDRSAFGQGYSDLEDEIIAGLPSTMKAGGQVYTPYSCSVFEVAADGTAATDIEHVVALAEAHDSGIADNLRRVIASDLDNLTIAAPAVNRAKSDRDAAEWQPMRHGAWFAERVIAVKLEYGLSVDPAERAALAVLLAGGGSQLTCVTPPAAFTDSPLLPGTPVKAVHFTELRTRIDALRLVHGLPSFSWTDAVLAPGVTPVKLQHLLELREALAAVHEEAGRPAPVWADVPLAAVPIRAVHLTELRAAVIAFE